MPDLAGMHSPGSETAHLLPPAGMKNTAGDVYRFHRVVPFYPPDPCIRPNEADLVCPPGGLQHKNHPNMPPAGVSVRPISDRFAFHKAREGSSKRPCHPEGRQTQVEQPCPCSNSAGYPSRQQADNFDNRYQGIAAQNHYQQQVNAASNYPAAFGNTNQPQWPIPSHISGNSQCSNQANASLQPQASGHAMEHSSSYSASSIAQQPMASDFAHTQRNAAVPSASIPNPYEVLGNATHGGDYITVRNAPHRQKLQPVGEEPDPACPNPYYPAPYVCQPVYNRKYLDDCPEQDGPPADSYTFL